MLKAPRCRCDSKSEDATLQQHYRKLDGPLHICTVHLHRAIDMQFIREAYRSFVFFLISDLYQFKLTTSAPACSAEVSHGEFEDFIYTTQRVSWFCNLHTLS